MNATTWTVITVRNVKYFATVARKARLDQFADGRSALGAHEAVHGHCRAQSRAWHCDDAAWANLPCAGNDQGKITDNRSQAGIHRIDFQDHHCGDVYAGRRVDQSAAEPGRVLMKILLIDNFDS